MVAVVGLDRFFGAFAFFQRLERFAKRLYISLGFAPVQLTAVFLAAGVFRFLLGDGRKIASGVQIGDDLLGGVFLLHQDMARLVLLAGIPAAFCFHALVFFAHVRFARRELLVQIIDQKREDDLLLGQIELRLVVGILVEFAPDRFLIEDFPRDQDFAQIVAEFRRVLQRLLSGLPLLRLCLRQLRFCDEFEPRTRDA